MLAHTIMDKKSAIIFLLTIHEKIPILLLNLTIFLQNGSTAAILNNATLPIHHLKIKIVFFC